MFGVTRKKGGAWISTVVRQKENNSKTYNQLLDPDKQDGEEINILNIRGRMFSKTFEKKQALLLYQFAAPQIFVLSKIQYKI